MKTQEKSIMNKFSVIVFIATMLIFGNMYGQERLVRGSMRIPTPTPVSSTVDTVSSPISIESAVDTVISSIAIDSVKFDSTNITVSQKKTEKKKDKKTEKKSEKKSDKKSEKKIETAVKSDLENEKFYVSNENFCHNEFFTWVGGGFSSLNAFPTFGDRDYRFGGILGLGYAYHFNPHWALSLGAEIALYNMQVQVSDLNDDYVAQDPDGEDIRYITKIDGYTEKERLYQLNIPLQLWFKTEINGRGDELYLSLGGKFGVPISSNYTSQDAHFQASGYYPSTNQTLYDQRDLGYGDNSGKTLKEKLNFDFSYIGSAEAGIKWNLNSPRYNLYTGVYFDYGINDILKKNDNSFLEYDQKFPDRFRTNSVLTSQYTQQGETNSFSDRVSVVALGLKVRFGFNLCSAEKSKREKAVKAEKPKTEKPKVEKPKVEKPVEQPKKAETPAPEPAPDRKNVKPIDYTPAPEPKEKEPYYKSDPLLEAEMKRAASEYGKLADVVVLQIEGYEANQSKLSPIMEKIVDDKIRMLQKYNNENYVIICEGHTCDLGRDEFNLNLGQSRAEAISEYLMTKGFNSENLVATSKGKLSPIVPNSSEANRKINRRVVFLIKEKR